MIDTLVYRAEQAFLGSCLQDTAAYGRGGFLSRDQWSDSRHAMIYTAIGFAAKEGSCGPIEVADQLGDFREKYFPYLIELFDGCFAPANAAIYAEIIRQHSKLRLASGRIAAVFTEIESAGTTDRALAKLRQAVDEVSSYLAPTSRFKMFRDAIDLAALERRRKLERSGVPTTIVGLDLLTGGFSGPTVTVVGARTGEGKSIIGGQIAINAAVCHGRPVGLISLEMGAGQIMNRMLTYLYGEGFPAEGDDAPLYIDDSSRELDEILYRIREWHLRFRIELCIIDYMQIIHAGGYRQRYEEVGAISRALKSVAMELGIPILVLAQLSREHVRMRRKPTLADLRECGSIEQDADNVWLLHCNKDRNGVIELEVAKHRDGKAGDVIDLEFWRERLCVREIL